MNVGLVRAEGGGGGASSPSFKPCYRVGTFASTWYLLPIARRRLEAESLF